MRGAPPHENDNERRTLIIECAARLFRHYGFAKTTIADIAREARMGVGTFYLVFASKDAIVEELSASAHNRVLEAMRAVAEARADESLSERLRGVLETRVATFLDVADEGEHACELVHCSSGAVRAVHARFRADEAELLRQVLEEAKERGELAEADLNRAVALVQRAYATLSPPWVFELTKVEARRTAYDMCNLLLLGLTSRAGR